MDRRTTIKPHLSPDATATGWEEADAAVAAVLGPDAEVTGYDEQADLAHVTVSGARFAELVADGTVTLRRLSIRDGRLAVLEGDVAGSPAIDVAAFPPFPDDLEIEP